MRGFVFAATALALVSTPSATDQTAAAVEGSISIEVAADRIGPITARLVPSRAALASLFPGAQVDERPSQGEGGFPDGGRDWLVMTGTRRLLDVHQDAQGAWGVWATEASVRTRRGLGPGALVAALADQGPLACSFMASDDGLHMRCSTHALPNVAYQFAATENEAKQSKPDGVMPAGFLPQPVPPRRIDVISWRPPAGRGPR